MTAAIGFRDPALADFVSGAFAAAPQIDGLVIADANGKATRAIRGASETDYQVDHFDVGSDLAVGRPLLIRSAPAKTPYWGPPVRKRQQETYLNYRVPIRDGEVYLGCLLIGISTRALSEVAKEMSDPPRSVSFVLYGQDHVFVHPFMTEGSRRVIAGRVAA